MYRKAIVDKNNVIELTGLDTIADPLTELQRADAGQLICQAEETELHAVLAVPSEQRLADGGGVVGMVTCRRESCGQDWGR